MGASVYVSGSLPSCPEDFNAAAYCLGAKVPGDKPAFLAVDPARGPIENWTFDELREGVLRAAGAYCRAGVRPGDRVVLLLGDVPLFPIAYFGAIAAGGVATPLSSQLAPAEVQSILAAVEPKAVVGGAHATLQPDELTQAEPIAFQATQANDPALLVFTSGSSGKPKGVLHAHRAFWARQSMRAGWHDIGPQDRVMHAGAFNWTYTLGVGLTDTWSVGGTAILNAGARAPDVWPKLARAYQPTVFAGAPGVYRRILKYGNDLGARFASLRHAVTAGEALSDKIAKDWRDATGKPLLEALGMSEVSTFISNAPDVPAAPGCVGKPQPGRKVAALDASGEPVAFGKPGQLAVHRTDPGLMLGYWRDEEATRAAMSGEWFLTGDLVTMRADGAIAYLGRSDDQMNAQGYRVDPLEVEQALAACPGVAECGVAEVTVSDGLKVIGAWIVPEPASQLDRKHIETHLAGCLATYKQPRAYFTVEALPQTPNGKLRRRALAGCGGVSLD